MPSIIVKVNERQQKHLSFIQLIVKTTEIHKDRPEQTANGLKMRLLYCQRNEHTGYALLQTAFSAIAIVRVTVTHGSSDVIE